MFAPAQPICPVAGIRAIEKTLIPSARPSLMERAGRAAAEDAVRLLIDRPGPVLVACGPGNNGGDGFVMARQLLQAGREVTVAFAGTADALPPDAAKAYADFVAAGGTWIPELPPVPARGWALVVDALFGIGLGRPVTGRLAAWIQTLNAQCAPRMALDIPSGLHADAGRLMGETFRATHTTTFIALKPGLLTLDGPDHCGEISLQRLEIDAPSWAPDVGWEITPSLFAKQLQPRPRNTHKGRYGDAAVLGGDSGMAGATLLAGRAALWLGAGRVYCGLLDPAAPSVDVLRPELMLRRAEALPEALSALAVGPGLGRSGAAADLVAQAIERDIPLLIDADGLNLVAESAELEGRLVKRTAPTLLTPHPAEAGRLLDCDTAEVQQDRVASARELARRYRATVVLKGCGSIIATADGRWYINGTGHPGMATAGMGDVLSGLVVSLLAQGWPPTDAMIAGVHLHGAAADRLAREGVGPVGLGAGEVVEAARGVFNGWLVARSRSPGWGAAGLS